MSECMYLYCISPSLSLLSLSLSVSLLCPMLKTYYLFTINSEGAHVKHV